MKKIRKITIASLFIVAIVMIIVTGFEWYFANRIFLNVKIAGTSFENLSTEQAKAKFSDLKLENQAGPPITFNQKIFNPLLKQLGVKFDAEATIKQALILDKDKSLLKRMQNRLLIFANSANLSPVYSIEESVLNEYLQTIAPIIEIPATDASIEILNGNLNITASKEGKGINRSKFKNDLRTFLGSHSPGKKIELELITKHPDVFEQGALLGKTQAVATLNSAPIILEFQNKSLVLPKKDLINLLSFEKDGASLKATLDKEKTINYFEKFVRQFEFEKIDSEIWSLTGEVIKQGRDGRIIDRDILYQQVLDKSQALTPNQKITLQTRVIAKETKTIKPPFESEDFAGRYIDINLTQQKLRLVEKNQIVGEYIISSGKPSMPTPVGLRYIENKSRRAWSNRYELYMPYWNSIGGGYGIHELPEWPNGYKEGQAHLGTPVSHGCVRLGVGDAEKVYNWAPVGTPVYIHK